jgi:fructose-bisphosphate aldolase class II
MKRAAISPRFGAKRPPASCSGIRQKRKPGRRPFFEKGPFFLRKSIVFSSFETGKKLRENPCESKPFLLVWPKAWHNIFKQDHSLEEYLMLVNATRMLEMARDGHYAVGQFNINNLEWTKAVLLEAEELKAPVILGVSMGAAKYMGGYPVVVAMVKAMDRSLGITVPVVLHLDHGDYDAAKACIEAGFTSIMFDGSHFPLEENIAKTKELVAFAHDKGLSIEAEVGAIGGTEDGVTADGEVADPKECEKIVALGIDFLAAGIGNIHGIYPADWKGLHIDALEKINKATSIHPRI